ncbi:MAG: hypothetical protein QOI91_1436 [Solirubrobacteraceae bacterium]|jgi:hypothetical protein|nr:hypothetical protein [Solirubrobacteraceae bacterium]
MSAVAPAPAAGARPRFLGVGVAYAVLGALTCAALYAWQADGYWSYSDGVYAYTARALLHGANLYSDVAAAQPPPTFWAGALALLPGETIGTLRVGLAFVTLLSGALVAVAVWKLTARAGAAVAGGVASLLAPWAVREHALLTPETFAAPLLMGCALLGSRTGGAAVAAGALGAGAAAFKLTWLVPVAAIALVAADRRRFVAGAVGAGAVLAGVSLALYGSALWDNVVTAQLETGTQAPRLILEYAEQAAWNLAPLVVVALSALWLRSRVLDRALLRTLVALAVGAGAVLATMVKDGSYVNVVVPLEPPLVALGAAGLALLVAEVRGRAGRAGVAGMGIEGGSPIGSEMASPESGRTGRETASPTGASRRRVRAVLAVAVAAATLAAAQTVSLLASPDDPNLFRHPFSGAYYARIASPDQVHARVARARRCPAGVAFSGPPYIAFAAGRRMPGNQGDPFILNRAGVHAQRVAAARRDRPRCPPGRG